VLADCTNLWKTKKNTQAKLYFKKCLLVSGFDYERGIHQKARAGLNRVSD
jgi:hypothetical protein